MGRIRRSLFAAALLFMALLCAKALWVWHYSVAGRDLLNGAAENDLLARRRWLLRNVATERFSLKQMPAFFPPVMQQEWAIGTLSMTSAALTNLVFLYPETREESKGAIATMIERVLRDDLTSYETNSWGEGALSTLDGNHGHIGYLAHLNFMLGAYRIAGGDARFDYLHRRISDALARRVLQSGHHYLETFPGQIFIPDNAATIASLSIAQLTLGINYQEPISAWLAQTRGRLLDPATGLIRPWIDSDGKGVGPPRGSYAAWTIYYLNWVDRNFAQEQYRLLKTNFAVKLPFGLAALREYPQGYHGHADVDSGPVIFGISTSGTGFMIAGARLGKDADYLQGLLTSAEVVGGTVGARGVRHYLFAPVVGEAIVLAMKTACNWDGRFVQAPQ
jgi:hypothetical protein